MAAQALSFIHRFEPGTSSAQPLLLLHGTGGNENDLMALGQQMAPGAPRLSPRGQVNEHGMPRFFRRLAEGVFDEDDLRRRVDDLARFVAEARETYDIPAPIAVGFSNGANIAAAMLVVRPDVLSGAVLLRPMTPFRTMPNANLGHKPVLMVSGSVDPIVRVDDAARLADTLKQAGADIDHQIVKGGHGVSTTDVALATEWLKRHDAIAFA